MLDEIGRRGGNGARAGNGWPGILLVAITYIYFLIFAQFGFLKRLDELAILGDHLKLVMAAMALGGIAASLLAARITILRHPARRLQAALAGAAAAALLSLAPMNVAAAAATAVLIGLSLGSWTVTLVANLRGWIGSRQPLLKVGLGTGLGYLTCNVPQLFTASPSEVGLAAAAACVLAFLFAGRFEDYSASQTTLSTTIDTVEASINTPAFPLLLIWFTALIWFDSAAFYIIQNSPGLKSGTWYGAFHLWRNGAVHLVAAVFSGWLIGRRGLRITLLGAFAALAGACLLLIEPAHAAPAAWLYPVGVSLYSVALVAYPSFVMRSATAKERTLRAGIIYAVGGWFGSSMGIGMAQNLHHVPVAFVAAAGLLFLIPVIAKFNHEVKRQATAMIVMLLAVMLVALGVQHLLPTNALPPQTEIQRGRQVYIAEGCIHCHSQYVRPNSPDVVLWGPVSDLEAIRRQHPPLIGNRRQGPDLSEVGGRRSALWLRMHFMNPRDISVHSIMPNYAYLFKAEGHGHETQGDALIVYLESMKSPYYDSDRQTMMAAWLPVVLRPNLDRPAQQATPSPDGPELFNDYCATCHAAGGRARVRWVTSFRQLPPNLVSDALPLVAVGDPTRSIAAIIKFGIPGTNMAGHEYLPDSQAETLAKWITQSRASKAGATTP